MADEEVLRLDGAARTKSLIPWPALDWAEGENALAMGAAWANRRDALSALTGGTPVVPGVTAKSGTFCPNPRPAKRKKGLLRGLEVKRTAAAVTPEPPRQATRPHEITFPQHPFDFVRAQPAAGRRGHAARMAGREWG